MSFLFLLTTDPTEIEELRLKKMQEFLHYCLIEFHQRNRHLSRLHYDTEKKAVHDCTRKLI